MGQLLSHSPTAVPVSILAPLGVSLQSLNSLCVFWSQDLCSGCPLGFKLLPLSPLPLSLPLDIHANTIPALPGFYHSPSPNLLQLAQFLPMKAQWLVPHVAIVIHQVVGQLEFVKGHNLPHPLGTFGWRVGVEVHSARRSRVGLACHQPGRTVEGVPGGAE